MTSPIEDLIKETRQKPWLYFGCYINSGHYLIDVNLKRPDLQYEKIQYFNRFDGGLVPKTYKTYQVCLTRLPQIGYTALSFWDNTVDSRGGSNSIFFAPDLNLGAETLYTDAKEKFYNITKRFPPLDFSRAYG